MRKQIAGLLVGVMAFGMLSGCGQSENDDTTQAAGSSDAASVAASDDAGTVSASLETTDEVGTVSITHSLGEATIEGVPQKVVVFDMGILDTLDELAIDAEIAVPQSNILEYLSKYEDASYVNAGEIKEPDTEAINGFAPDVIFISGRQSDYYEELAKIAPTVYFDIDSTQYMDDFKSNMVWIGEIFDKTEEVQEKVTEIESVIEETKAAVDPEQKALIILTNDGSISAYGAGSRFGIIHDVFGITAVDTDIEASTHGQEVNYEYIAEKNPDILYVVDRTQVVGGDTQANATLDNELVNGTNAVINNKVISLTPDVWYLSGGGLQSVRKMAEEIQASMS